MRKFTGIDGAIMELNTNVIRDAYRVGGTVHDGMQLDAHSKDYKTILVVKGKTYQEK